MSDVFAPGLMRIVDNGGFSYLFPLARLARGPAIVGRALTMPTTTPPGVASAERPTLELRPRLGIVGRESNVQDQTVRADERDTRCPSRRLSPD